MREWFALNFGSGLAGLGLRHEHQSPNVPYTWNRQQLIQDFAAMGWSAQYVDSQVLTPLVQSSDLSVTAYDPMSIMVYWIRSRWVSAQDNANFESCPSALADWCVEPTTNLSVTDQQAIASLYPGAVAACTYQVRNGTNTDNPLTVAVSSGGTIFTVETQSNCQWSVTSNDD